MKAPADNRALNNLFAPSSLLTREFLPCLIGHKGKEVKVKNEKQHEK